MKYPFLYIVLLFFSFARAEVIDHKKLENLYDESILEYHNMLTGSINTVIITQYYYNRGGNKYDTIMITLGYNRSEKIQFPVTYVKYAHSILSLTKNYKHVTYPTLGYLLTGWGLKNIRANDSLIQACAVARESGNLPQKSKIIEPSILNKFESPMLPSEKDEVISRLKQENKLYKAKNFWLILSLICIFLLAAVFFFKNIILIKRYKKIISKQFYSVEGSIVEIRANPEIATISPEIIEDILEKLDCFERKQGFLSAKLSLSQLAHDLNTNPNYLSRIINLTIEKNYSQYINELRINFTLEELRTNQKFRKYSIKAIAKECGFNSASSFTRAFKKTTGLYPSYFVKQLVKSKKLTK
jgi:AraC-like DNA-binding protein